MGQGDCETRASAGDKNTKLLQRHWGHLSPETMLMSQGCYAYSITWQILGALVLIVKWLLTR